MVNNATEQGFIIIIQWGAEARSTISSPSSFYMQNTTQPKNRKSPEEDFPSLKTYCGCKNCGVNTHLTAYFAGSCKSRL